MEFKKKKSIINFDVNKNEESQKHNENLVRNSNFAFNLFTFCINKK